MKKAFYSYTKCVIMDLNMGVAACAVHAPVKSFFYGGEAMRLIRLAARLAPAALVMLMCGCNIGTGVESLLSPPKLTEEQNDIYRALTDSVGSSVTLRYPRSGDCRSAFVIADLDSDGSDEAIVFYEDKNPTAAQYTLRLNILDRSQGGWHSVSDHPGAGASVDKVIIAPVGQDNRLLVIVGYANVLGVNDIFRAYTYTGGELKALFQGSYTYADIFDADSDGTNEILSLVDVSEQSSAYARIIECYGDGTESSDYGVSAMCGIGSGDIINVTRGNLGDSSAGVYIDLKQADGRVVTEIIYSISGALRSPFTVNPLLRSATAREVSFTSHDIDGDGICEIPVVSAFPGYQYVSGREKLYITDWLSFENYSLVKKYSSFYCASDGYCFMLPARWEGMVTVKQDTFSGEYVFYKFEDTLSQSVTELMRFATVTSQEDIDRLASEGYFIISREGYTSYMAKLSDDASEPLVLTASEITNGFYTVE